MLPNAIAEHRSSNYSPAASAGSSRLERQLLIAQRGFGAACLLNAPVGAWMTNSAWQGPSKERG